MNRALPPTLTNHPWRVFAGIALLTLALYSVSFQGAFVYDDTDQIVLNTRLHDLGNFRDVILSGLRQIRAILNLSFAIDWAISGPAPWSFHLTNTALHLATCALLFIYLRRVLGHAPLAIFLITGLFAVHPLQAGTVAYVMGRVSIFQALFTFGCLALLASPRPRTRRWALPLAALSLLAKESCVLIPIFLFLHEITFGGKRIREIGAKPILAGLFVMLLIFPLQWLLRDPVSMYEGTTGFDLYPYLPYLVTQGYYFLLHLWLVFSPAHQSLIHEHPVFAGAVPILGILGLSVVFAAVILGARKFRSYPATAFFIGFYLLTLAPTNSLVQMINPFAEYRLYQANVSVFAAMALSLEFALGRSGKLRYRVPIGASLILIFAVLNLGQQKLWADKERLIAHSIDRYPESQALHMQMAQHYNEQRDWPKFEAELKIAERLALADPYRKTLRPSFMLAHFYAVQNRLADADRQLDFIARTAPGARLPIGFAILRLKLHRAQNRKTEFDAYRATAAQAYGEENLPRWE